MDASVFSPIEIAQNLSSLRESAGLKQGELAKALGWSPATLSRIESGERPISAAELEALLAKLKSPESEAFRRALSRSWEVIDRPPLDHPDQDLLWSAEEVAQEVSSVRQSVGISAAFDKRLGSYLTEFRRASLMLLKRDHQVAFVGSIGIGKSTAICKLSGLEIPGQQPGQRASPVLEVGAGGTTICEVHLRVGPDYGISIDPKSESELRSDVADFAELFFPAADSDPNDEVEMEAAADQPQGISREVERAIRQMSGLKKIRGEKMPDGKRAHRDEAQELATSARDKREFTVSVLSRMELHKRDRRDVWYDPSCGKGPLEWLKEIFEKINNGRHPEFSIPRRIEVSVPTAFLKLPNLAVRVVDTKGIDRTAARADLESLFDDPHTSTVICSHFNSAPSPETRVLLERAKEAGFERYLKTRVTLLVLPRPDEAAAVKDDSGARVETEEEGYALKGEQVSMSLQPLGLEDLSVEFFNSMTDDPDRLRHVMEARVNAIRGSFRGELLELIHNAKAMLLNLEQEQAKAVTRQAASLLQAALLQCSKPKSRNVHVYESLLTQVRSAHVATVRATVNREGEWHNLNYQHHLGFGARRAVMMLLGDAVEHFAHYCSTTAEADEFKPATELLQQAERLLRTEFEAMLRRVQLMGQTAFIDELKQDPQFWIECYREWGRGPGYRTRVLNRNEEWFNQERRVELERHLQQVISREWASVIERVRSVLEVDD